MKVFKNYPNQKFVPFVKGTKIYDVSDEQAEEIAKDFNLFVYNDTRYDRNGLYLDLGNECAIEILINEYRKGLFLFRTITGFVPFDVQSLFKWEGTDMYKYNAKKMQKFVDFYKDAFNKVIELEKQYYIERALLEHSLLEDEYLKFPIVKHDDIEFKKYGLYTQFAGNIVARLSSENELLVYLDEKINDCKITEERIYKDYLNRGHILSYLDFEEFFRNDTSDYKNDNLIKYDIYLDLLRSVKFDFCFNHKDNEIKQKDNVLYLNNRVIHDYSISKLDYVTLLCFRNFLIAEVKKATN